jgi:hypothetical protein
MSKLDEIHQHKVVALFLRVMLTCALRAYDKLPKNRNVAFNDTKNLMLR